MANPSPTQFHPSCAIRMATPGPKLGCTVAPATTDALAATVHDSQRPRPEPQEGCWKKWQAKREVNTQVSTYDKQWVKCVAQLTQELENDAIYFEAGRVSQFARFWYTLTSDRWIHTTLKGAHIEFDRLPFSGQSS